MKHVVELILTFVFANLYGMPESSIVDDKNLKNITVNFDSKSNKVRQVNLNYTYNPKTIDDKVKSIIRIYNLGEIIEINKRMMKKTSFFWSPEVYNLKNTKHEEMYFPEDFFVHKTVVNYNIKGKFIDSIVNHNVIFPLLRTLKSRVFI